jgi:hypothetical protein
VLPEPGAEDRPGLRGIPLRVVQQPLHGIGLDVTRQSGERASGLPRARLEEGTQVGLELPAGLRPAKHRGKLGTKGRERGLAGASILVHLLAQVTD